MPSFCAVLGCSKRANRDKVRFFRICKPLKNRGERLDALSKERRQSWVRSLKRGNLSETYLKNARICGNHFVSGEPAQLEDTDNPDWVPSVNMGYFIKTPDEQNEKRHGRSIKPQMKRFKTNEVDETQSTAVNLEPRVDASTEPLNLPEQYDEQKSRHDAATQTDLNMDHLRGLFGDRSVAEYSRKLKKS